MDNQESEVDQMPDLTSYTSMNAPQQQPAKKNNKRKMLLLAGGVLAVLVVLAGVYWFVLRDTASSPSPKASTQKQPTTAQESVAPTPADSTPTTFKSAKLNIELTHRKDWSLVEVSGGTEIVLTSPRTPYTKQDGAATTGVFTLKIRQGVTDAQKAAIEKSVATRDSEVIAYAAPTEQQRYYTNVSYAGQKDVFNFFIVTGSTSLKAGTSYAYMLTLDSGTYLITGGYGTDKNDTLAYDSVPASAIDGGTVQEAKHIVESLKIF